MSILRNMQASVAAWRSRQPWADEGPVETTLGLAEETGELCRAVLKMHQGIRGTRGEWMAEARKELGDVVIKACDVATVLGIDLVDAVDERWQQVSQREFGVDNRGHGMPA